MPKCSFDKVAGRHYLFPFHKRSRRLAMIELTEAAKTQLDGYFADKEKTPIRVFMASGG
jgi:hypothetical protein